MVTSDGCSGWSHGAGCWVAFFSAVLSICLLCLFLFPSLGLWDSAAEGDRKHPVPQTSSMNMNMNI